MTAVVSPPAAAPVVVTPAAPNAPVKPTAPVMVDKSAAAPPVVASPDATTVVEPPKERGLTTAELARRLAATQQREQRIKAQGGAVQREWEAARKARADAEALAERARKSPADFMVEQGMDGNAIAKHLQSGGKLSAEDLAELTRKELAELKAERAQEKEAARIAQARQVVQQYQADFLNYVQTKKGPDGELAYPATAVWHPEQVANIYKTLADQARRDGVPISRKQLARHIELDIIGPEVQRIRGGTSRAAVTQAEDVSEPGKKTQGSGKSETSTRTLGPSLSGTASAGVSWKTMTKEERSQHLADHYLKNKTKPA